MQLAFPLPYSFNQFQVLVCRWIRCLDLSPHCILKIIWGTCSKQFHCVTSIRIRRYSGPYFLTFGLNTDQNNFEYELYLRSVWSFILTLTYESNPNKCNVSRLNIGSFKSYIEIIWSGMILKKNFQKHLRAQKNFIFLINISDLSQSCQQMILFFRNIKVNNVFSPFHILFLGICQEFKLGVVLVNVIIKYLKVILLLCHVFITMLMLL